MHGIDTLVTRGVVHGMRVTKLGCAKARKLWAFVGLGNGVRFGVHNNTLANLRRGLVERVFFVEQSGGLATPPSPKAGVFSRLNSFRASLLRNIPRVHPMAAEQFVEHYDGRRRTIYQRAYDTLQSMSVQVKDSYLSTFVKAEKINFTAKPDPAPRVIQPRHPRYNLCVGRYILAIEKLVYKGIASVWGGPTVMKGYNALETARVMRDMWEEFRDPVGIGLDASRFDQHVSADALRWEHSVYARCFPATDRAELLRLLSWQIHNKGFGRASDGSIKYRVEGCRMSGDMNTALGNCLLMCAMVHQFCHERGIRARLANNGDDCMLIMERSDAVRVASLIPGFFLEYGFTMKVEPMVDVFEQLEFCQTRPVWNGVAWVMCRDPRVCVAKDMVTTVDLQHPKHAKSHLSSVGQCGLALSGGLPVLQEFYRALIREGGQVTCKDHPANVGSGFQRLALGMEIQERVVSSRSRYSFWLAFGITPDEQIATEGLYATWRMDSFTPGVCDYTNGRSILIRK